MDEELDDYIDHLNGTNDLSPYVAQFKSGLDDAYRLFGEYAFRKITPKYRSLRRSPINKLLFTTVTVLLSRHRPDYSSRIAQIGDDDWTMADQLAQRIEDDKVLFSALTWSTNAKENFKVVYAAVKELFDQHLLQQ